MGNPVDQSTHTVVLHLTTQFPWFMIHIISISQIVKMEYVESICNFVESKLKTNWQGGNG